MISVESNIPIPAACIDLRGRPKGSAHAIYPWDEMKVGDSFRVRHMGESSVEKRAARSLIHWRHKYRQGRYEWRLIEEDGRRVVRIWRVA